MDYATFRKQKIAEAQSLPQRLQQKYDSPEYLAQRQALQEKHYEDMLESQRRVEERTKSGFDRFIEGIGTVGNTIADVATLIPGPIGTAAKALTSARDFIVGSGDKKEYPDNYTEDVISVFDKISFGSELFISGSNSLRSQQFGADYDGYEVVSLHKASNEAAIADLVKRFQEIVRNTESAKNIFIQDIKSGEVAEWKVIPDDARLTAKGVAKYNPKAAQAKLKSLKDAKIITEAEYNSSLPFLKSKSRKAFVEARNNIKFHILRWTPKEVLSNKKVLRDGSAITLNETFGSPTLTKLDVVSLIQRSRYVDFSIIYEFKNNGKILNPVKLDLEDSLKEDIEALKLTGNHFKALKRLFSLENYKGNEKKAKEISEVLNSDLGRLYFASSDLGTLQTLLEEKEPVPISDIRFQINQLKNRLSNITAQSYLRAENKILGLIDEAARANKSRLLVIIKDLKSLLDSLLESRAKKEF